MAAVPCRDHERLDCSLCATVRLHESHQNPCWYTLHGVHVALRGLSRATRSFLHCPCRFTPAAMLALHRAAPSQRLCVSVPCQAVATAAGHAQVLGAGIDHPSGAFCNLCCSSNHLQRCYIMAVRPITLLAPPHHRRVWCPSAFRWENCKAVGS